MIRPRLAPSGVGRGCFMPCVAPCGPLCDVLVAGSIERYCRTIKPLYGLVNGLYVGFAFWDMFRPAGHGRKNSRLEAIGGHTSGGKLVEGVGI